MEFQSINPATGDILRKYTEHDASEVDAIISATDAAFRSWRWVPTDERCRHLLRMAALLRQRKSAYARLMADEMGKPVGAGESEAEKCAWLCEFYAENAPRFLAPKIVATDASRSRISYQPLGVLLALMPWNFPLWQVLRAAVPAIAAGNTVVLKHANNVSGMAMTIETLFRHAGFPADAFRTVLVDIDKVPSLIRHPKIRAVTLTGSTKAGRAVASVAGEALKKCVLELGGSDPFIVLADADLARAASAGTTSRMFANGQSCIAAKRFIVVDSVHDAFVEKLRAEMNAVVIGNPLDRETELGPLARMDIRDTLHRQVTESIAKGAKAILGGEIPDGFGAFYPPTILTDVGPGMPAYTEELFGPVAAVIRVADQSEAVAIANDTEYGLGAAIFSGNPERAEQIAESQIEAGSCFVNTFVRSDPRLPFGGIKNSGFGRELGEHGIREFVNIKTVFIG